jgi:hypothetical protein
MNNEEKLLSVFAELEDYGDHSLAQGLCSRLSPLLLRVSVDQVPLCFVLAVSPT